MDSSKAPPDTAGETVVGHEANHDTVIFPLISMNGNLSSLNFFDREKQVMVNIIENVEEIIRYPN